MPRLIFTLIEEGRRDIADLFKTGRRKDYKEALRRLFVICHTGHDSALSGRIATIINDTPQEHKAKTPTSKATSTTSQGNLFKNGEISIKPATKHHHTNSPATPVEDPFNYPLPFANSGTNHLGISRLSPPNNEDPTADPWREDLLPPQISLNLSGNENYALKPATKKSTTLPAGVSNRIGSKAKLMPLYDTPQAPLIPRTRLSTFVDAFGGSLSVTAYMVATGRIGPETNIVICEMHPHLHAIYVAIQRSLEKLLNNLKYLQENQSPKLYEDLKAEYNRAQDLQIDEDSSWIAARYMFLLATCYGSILRQNGSGHINVISRNNIGRIKIYDEANLRHMHAVLQNAHLINGEYDQFWGFLDNPERAMVIMDPPYHGQETTTEYGVPPFDETQQTRIAQQFFDLQTRGVMAAVTNSDTPFIREIYAAAPTIKEISAADHLARGKGNGGQQRNELFIANYPIAA